MSIEDRRASSQGDKKTHRKRVDRGGKRNGGE